MLVKALIRESLLGFPDFSIQSKQAFVRPAYLVSLF